METQFIHDDDWEEFATAFPAAVAWILQRNLEGEYKHLLGMQKAGLVTFWQRRRLVELERWASRQQRKP
jgi:hypothetical protein